MRPLAHSDECGVCRRGRARRRSDLVRALRPWALVVMLCVAIASANVLVELLGRITP